MTTDKLWNSGRMKSGIRQRGPDTFEVVYDAPRGSDGRRRQVSVSVKARTLKQAREEQRRILADRDTGGLASPERMTVGQFLARWDRDYVSQNVRPKTARAYRTVVKNWLVPHLGTVPLSRLTAAHIVELHALMRTAPRKDGRAGHLSGNSRLGVHRVLKESLGHAVRWGLLRYNPADAIEAPKADHLEMRALSAEETHRLLEVAGPTDIGPVVLLAVNTGLRRGELLGLKWGDVDLDMAQIRVVRSLHTLAHGEMVYTAPKSRHGQRPVDLPPSAAIALRKHRERMEARAQALGAALADEMPVFARYDFKPMLGDTVSHVFSDIAKRTGLGRVRFHDLRHTHASLLLKAGTHPLIVSRRLGHAGVEITLNRYSHVLPGIQKAAALAFDVALGKGPGEPVGEPVGTREPQPVG